MFSFVIYSSLRFTVQGDSTMFLEHVVAKTFKGALDKSDNQTGSSTVRLTGDSKLVVCV